MNSEPRGSRVAFCGPGEPTSAEYEDADVIGFGLAIAGCTLYCGGLGGSMEAACKGAKRAGGTTIGILPGYDAAAANRWIDFPICTGMGQGRNTILVASVDVVVACGGGWGTLCEIALAGRLGKPVVVQGLWTGIVGLVPGGPVHEARNAAESVELALRLLRGLS